MRSRRGREAYVHQLEEAGIIRCLLDEYLSLHALGWSEGELRQLVENGFKAAFVEGRERLTPSSNGSTRS